MSHSFVIIIIFLFLQTPLALLFQILMRFRLNFDHFLEYMYLLIFMMKFWRKLPIWGSGTRGTPPGPPGDPPLDPPGGGQFGAPSGAETSICTGFWTRKTGFLRKDGSQPGLGGYPPQKCQFGGFGGPQGGSGGVQGGSPGGGPPGPKYDWISTKSCAFPTFFGPDSHFCPINLDFWP
jgi:hypothetical protein